MSDLQVLVGEPQPIKWLLQPGMIKRLTSTWKSGRNTTQGCFNSVSIFVRQWRKQRLLEESYLAFIGRFGCNCGRNDNFLVSYAEERPRWPMQSSN